MKFGAVAKKQWRSRSYALLAIALFALVYLYKLGSLAGGLSSQEHLVASTPIGLHGLYHQPMFLPLEFVRSAIYFVWPAHGQTLTRLASVPFGMLSIFAIYAVARWWYGGRTALLTGLLFATSAWTLHISRLASDDVMYLLALPALLVSVIAIRKYFTYWLTYVGCFLIWISLLYLPGLVWFVILTIFLQKRFLVEGWQQQKLMIRAVVILLSVAALTLLGVALHRPNEWRLWLGLPSHFAAPLTLFKQFGAVFVHLFIRGPLYPQQWLGKAPLLDIFSLAMCVVGIYLLARHFSAFRARILLAYFLMSAVLIALAGPVGLSLLVPMLYVLIATGIAYLSREWLRTFPLNPIARGLGLVLLSVAVALSCLYNLRAYFVAWPHNEVTKATFRYHQ